MPHIEQQKEKRLRGIDVVVDHQDAPAGIGRRLRLRLHLAMLFITAAARQGSISGRRAFSERVAILSSALYRVSAAATTKHGGGRIMTDRGRPAGGEHFNRDAS